MKSEVLLDAIGQIDEEILEKHRQIDLRLARRYTQKRAVIRLLGAAACLVLVLALALPLAALANPIGRAVLMGDYKSLTAQINQIEGIALWQEQTLQKLEQTLPENIYGQLQTSPLFRAVMQPHLAGLAVQDSFADQKPYHLYFLSNGDGTCTLRYVTTNSLCYEDYVIEIPEKSPAGDTVTIIDLEQSSQQNGMCRAGVPGVLTASVMEALLQTARENEISDFHCNQMLAYFMRCSLADLGPVARQQMLDTYPMAAFGDIYVLDRCSSATELEQVYELLLTYCEWDEEKSRENLDQLLRMARQSESREQAELCLTVLRYADLQRVVGMHIPSTVECITQDTWAAFPNLETVTVAQDHPTLRMIDGCLVDTVQGALKLYLREDGNFPTDADIRVLDSYAFVLYDPQASADGQEKLAHLHIPESVDEIRDDCFGDLNPGDDWTIRIELPENLRYFGKQSQSDGSAMPVYCYPGTLAEWESNISFGKAAKQDYIYLLTEDAEQPIIFRFPSK